MAGATDPGNPGGAAAAATTTTAPATAAAAASWFSTLPPEQIGYIQNKGFAEPDAAKAAVKLATEYQKYEGFRGIPQDRILALPTEGDEAATKAFWQRLGAPVDPKEYTFEGVKFGDDETTAKFTDALRTTAATLGMPKDMATRFTAEIAKQVADNTAAADAAVAATLKTEREKLEADWGPPTGDKFQQNMMIANNAAASLGVTKEQLEALNQVIGGTAVAQMFRDLGIKLGEAKYVTDPNQPNALMGREQAIARRMDLAGIDANGNAVPGKGDPAWRTRLLAKGAAEMREWNDLNKIIQQSL